MKNFIIKNGRIEIKLNNGKLFVIYLTEDSGSVFYRYKIDTISDVKHPGICLGVDGNNIRWFMHNHFEDGKPTFATKIAFSKGQKLFIQNQSSANSKIKILELGLRQILEGSPYNLFNYNCQSFISLSINNKNTSEDVEKWTERVLIGSLIFFGFRFFNNK